MNIPWRKWEVLWVFFATRWKFGNYQSEKYNAAAFRRCLYMEAVC